MADSQKAGRSRLPSTFWLFLTGQTISNMGSAFTAVAVPLLVFRRTGSPFYLGVSNAMSYVPWMFFGVIGGTLMDRVDRKRAMILSDVGRALTICVLPVLAATGALQIGWIFLILFVQTTLQIPFLGGQTAAITALVDEDQFVRANALISGSNSAATLSGTALAGLLFAIASIPTSFWFDAGSFVVSVLTLAIIRPSFNKEPATGLRLGTVRETWSTLVADTKAGLQYIWHRKVLRYLAMQIFFINTFGSMASSQIALYAARRLGAGNSGIGEFYAAPEVGVIALSLVAGRLGRRLGLARMLLFAVIIYGTANIVLGTLTSYPAAVVVYAVLGAGVVLYNVSVSSWRQRVTPNELMGRMTNISYTIAWSTIPIGSLIGGSVVSATHRVPIVFIGAGSVIILVGLIFYRLTRREVAASGGDGAPASPG